MASITVRNLSDDTKERLRQRAQRHGRSLEAELRSILDAAANENTGGKSGFPYDLIAELGPTDFDINDLIEEHRRIPHKPFEFEE